jgi:hypothetical protein
MHLRHLAMYRSGIRHGRQGTKVGVAFQVLQRVGHGVFWQKSVLAETRSPALLLALTIQYTTLLTSKTPLTTDR